MSKMTPEKKALNKAANALRNRAYRHRRNARDSEREVVKAAVESSPLGLARDATSDALQAASTTRKDAIAAIQTQIDALLVQMDAVKQHHDPLVEAAAQRRRAAYQAFGNEMSARQKEVDAKYPDLEGVWSPGTWKSLDEFLTPAAAAASEKPAAKIHGAAK